jgi:hypothetical protein
MAGLGLACLSLSAGLFAAKADVAMRLNTPGIISSAREISIEGVITPGGYRAISGAQISLKYDPTLLVNGSQPTLLRASPLVAGTPYGSRTAFVAADDGTNGQVFAFNMNAAPGTDSLITSKLRDKTLEGRIRSSMAVYKGPDGTGRLYVLTTKGALYCFH